MNEEPAPEVESDSPFSPLQLRILKQCEGVQDRLITQIRVKYPGKARDADYDNSRKSAIHLFCETCMGGSKKDAGDCRSDTCPLWQYRPNPSAAAGVVPIPGKIPSLADYEALIEDKTSDAQRAQWEKSAEVLRKVREAKS